MTQGFARPLRPTRKPAQPPSLECLSFASSLFFAVYISKDFLRKPLPISVGYGP